MEYSVSRSIGDAYMKDWVLAELDMKNFQLTPDMDFLVLASDGLWAKGKKRNVYLIEKMRLI